VLRHYDADIVALQETMPGRATDLCHVLARAGYPYGFASPRLHNRGQCVLSRIPLARVAGPRPPHARFYPRAWLELEMVDAGVRLAAVYGPPAGPAIPAFWRSASSWLARRATRPFLMLGDFNAGASLVDADDYHFRCGESFAALTGIGLVDLWRKQHGQRREHTWFSSSGPTRAGRGFRIDHAFASPSVARRVTGCRYDHAVRERGWSDHSLLLLDLALSDKQPRL
jgi:exonuclease III